MNHFDELPLVAQVAVMALLILTVPVWGVFAIYTSAGGRAK